MNTVELLKANGYRLTRQRQEILKVLCTTPLSVQEVRQALQNKHIVIDLVSIYRNLEILSKLQVVRTVDFGDSKMRYERYDGGKHHHHLVCTECQSVEDVTTDEKALLKTVNSQSDFRVTSHNLEFFGICYKCQKKNA